MGYMQKTSDRKMDSGEGKGRSVCRRWSLPLQYSFFWN